jgi:hypothetical protein
MTDTPATTVELAITEQGGLVDSDTGAPIDATSSDAVIGAGLAYLRWLEDRIKIERHRLGDIMLGRMDADASWTRHAGGVTMSAPSPAAGKSEWNAVDLRRVTSRLVAEGKLTAEAAERCFRPKPEEVAAAGVKAILATLGKRDQSSVRACNVPKPAASRSVKVV